MTKAKIICSNCGAKCWESEKTCWQCGRPLTTPPSEDNTVQENSYITFDTDLIDTEIPTDSGVPSDPMNPTSTKEGYLINHEPTEPVMRLTFCKFCGYQNQEGVSECGKCHKELEWVSAKTKITIEPITRFWGFDVLGFIWVILGLAAVYSRIFLVHTVQGHPSEPSDYLWTGVIVCIPGVLIFARHVFSRFLFWVMSLISLFVWFVIFVVWFTGHLFVSHNIQVGLTWMVIFSVLTVFSYFVVRQNEEFNPLL